MWALEVKDLLKHLNIWQVVDGSEIIPRPPAAPAVAGSTTTSAAPNPLDPSYDSERQSTDSSYLTSFHNFLQDWRAYRNNYEKANGTICTLLEPFLRSQYKDDKFNDRKVLWEAIHSDFEKVIKFEGRYEMAKRTDCKLELYPSISEWIKAPENIINDLTICNINFSKLPSEFSLENFGRR